MLATIIENPAIAASVSAILVALCNVLKRWCELRDRAAHREAVLRLHGNGSALDALARSVPPPTGDINSGPIVLLAIGFAAALYAPPSLVAEAESAKECQRSSDCQDGDRCERGRCVSNARRPRPPFKPRAAADESLALWWPSRSQRRDVFESVWDAR